MDPTTTARRLARAAGALQDAGLDALLLTPGADLRYLTGYPALALERLTCLALPRTGEPVLVVPELERPAALAAGAGDLDLQVVGFGETDDAYALVAERLRAALGTEPATVGLADRMWAQQVLEFRRVLPAARQRLAGEVTAALRLVKSAEEVAALRRAGAAIDAVHQRLGELRWVGRTEREIARDIGDAILDAGHATVNFVIVATGPNGASPHHKPGERVVRAGDLAVVDIGGTTPDGYCSDCTRTYAVGTVPPDAQFYDVLAEAQEAACAAVRPGVSAGAVDAAARSRIDAAGYGEFFVHRTGHGIGLEEHEQPWIVQGNGTPLASGMCFSVEPGIYLPDRHGARIEDIVAVTEDGVERLNLAPRELVVLAG